MGESFGKLLDIIERNIIMSSIRTGLIKVMPVAIIGSIVVLLEAMLSAMQGFFPSAVIDSALMLTEIMNAAMFGMMALYIVVFISISYMEKKEDKDVYLFGAPIAAVAGFVILNGGLSNDLLANGFGIRGSFSAIVSAVVASVLYHRLCRRIRTKSLYTDGADSSFNHILSCLLPIGIILIFFSLCQFAMSYAFGVSSLQALFSKVFTQLFNGMGNSMASGLLFVFLSSIMWLCGIHGTNVLAGVQETLFSRGVNTNMFDVFMGNDPTVLFTGTFFNVFVYVGGCGSLLCLLIALLLFSKRGGNRYLAKAAIFPTLFNINEMLMFGFPVVLNPYMVIPFIVTPILFTLTSAAAMLFGLVPYTVHPVEWTSPVLFSGYFSTGSLSGSVLQLFNLVLGVVIYCPFVKMYDTAQLQKTQNRLNMLVALLQKSEETNQRIELMEERGNLGNIAKNMASDLRKALERKEINVYYQPQFDEKMNCIGTEALLRWEHPLYGMLYPPLAIKLAEEEGILYDLEQYVFSTVADRIKDSEKDQIKNLKFSVNVTVKTLMSPSFELFLNNLMQDYHIQKGSICIEITEQMALQFDESIEKKLNRIHEMGYLLAIDDFSMGNTSLKYLQSNQFDIVKLDGNLVKNLDSNSNNKEIIGSIVYLAQSMGFDVLAEYVETEENRQMLEDIGCTQYQGYLYSRAVPYDELCNLIQKGDVVNKLQN